MTVEALRVNPAPAKNGGLPTTKKRPKREPKESFLEPPMMKAVVTYLNYVILFVLGYISDFLARVGLKKLGGTYSEAVKNNVSC